MRRRIAMATIAAATVLLPLLPTAGAWADSPTPPLGLRDRQPVMVSNTDTILVTFDRGQSDPAQAATDAVEQPADQVADANITKVTPITSKIVAATLDQPLTHSEAAAIGEQAEKADEVKAAEPAATMTTGTTNDTYFSFLWNLSASSPSNYGVNAEGAWPASTGANTIVGVIDTGITAHPDLTGSTTSVVGGNVIGGYDFITNVTDAGDGDGPDSDPTDVGDFCASDPDDNVSSWHGTHVAGIIAAIRNNGRGVVGVAPDAKIEPLRVLGRCGGSETDVISAVLWGSGVGVIGLPANPHPASVLNLSLGGDGPCTVAMQSAINSAVAKGVPVVVAAGNSSDDLVDHSPANCNNVIRVVASTFEGTRASYSTYGSSAAPATIAAPGGSGNDDANANDWIVSTWNSGTTTSGTSSYVGMVGTSMAAPHVAGIAAMLKQIDPTMTPAEIREYLTSTATAMPSCGTTECGAGIVNTVRAVTPAALARLQKPAISGTALVGATLSTTGSGVGGASYTYQWYRSGAPVSGATRPSYTLGSADLGTQISVTVTASLLGQHASMSSAATGQVASGQFRNSKAPYTTGTYKKGRTLKVNPGSWSPSPSSVKYQWLRNGASISRATKQSYKLGSKDKGKRISVRVTISRASYLTKTVSTASHKIR